MRVILITAVLTAVLVGSFSWQRTAAADESADLTGNFVIDYITFIGACFNGTTARGEMIIYNGQGDVTLRYNSSRGIYDQVRLDSGHPIPLDGEVVRVAPAPCLFVP